MSLVELATYCLGIYVCYIYYGVVQERINTQEYEPDDQLFRFPLFLVFVQCTFNCVFAFIVVLIRKPKPNRIPQSKYFMISVCYIFAMFCSNYALRFVNYPTQVLGKSCKMIPVMLLGMLIYGRRYSVQEIFCVLLIFSGISVFMLMKASTATDEKENELVGLVMLLISLALDGVTGSMQDHASKRYSPNTHHFMLYQNVWGILVLLVCLIAMDQLVPALTFCATHPAVIKDLVLFSIASALGQNFIFLLITRFGALYCAIVTTTRKFFTILGSVVWFGHALSAPQWLGVVLVFTGLGWNLAIKAFQNPIKPMKQN
eukprot:Rmarinus@m.9328